MELNPRHPIINELLTKVKDEKTDEDTENLAWLLLDNALMQSGFQPADVDAFAARALKIIQSGLALESSDLLPEMEVPDDPGRRRTTRTRSTLDAFGDDDAEERGRALVSPRFHHRAYFSPIRGDGVGPRRLDS